MTRYHRTLVILWVAWVILGTIDLGLTQWGLDHGGAYEGNLLYPTQTFLTMLAMKALGIVALGALVWGFRTRAMGRLLAAAVGLMIAVDVHNLGVVLTLLEVS